MDHLASRTSSGTVWPAAVALLPTIMVVLRALRKRKSSKAAAPPVLPGVALVRFARAMVSNGPLEAIGEQQAKLGRVFTASALLGLFKVIFLVGPEVSSHFYVAPESEMSHGSLDEFTVPIFGPEVAFGVDHRTRSEQYRFFFDVLKPRSIKASIGAMAEEVENYFSKWGDHGTIDLKHKLDHVLKLIASRYLLGKEVRESMLDEVFELFLDLDNSAHLISILFPYLPTQAHCRRDRARQRLKEIFIEVIRSCRNSGTHENDDVLQRLINSRCKDRRATTDAEVVGLLLAAVFGGKHASCVTSTWIGVELLSHPNHLAAVVDEQDRLIAWRNGTDRHRIDSDVMQEMSILHCCVKEVLRLHAPIVALVRQARKHFTVQTKEGEKYTIPGGHTVMSMIMVNNYLPHIYKDPHVFDPRQFALGREEDNATGPISYLSFGAGRHACTGEYFAYMQIKVIWSYLLTNFELKMVSPFPGINWSSIFPEPKGKVMVSYRRRQL